MTGAGAADRPPAALLALDGWRIRRLDNNDVDGLLDISDAGLNRPLFDLPELKETGLALIDRARSNLWSLPMLFLRDGEPAGFGFTGLPNSRNLNALLLTVFRPDCIEPLPAALYVRHLFWNFPLHRLYVQFPLLEESRQYVEMYERIGFEREGVLAGHAMLGGAARDVIAMGLLRTDFERWSSAREPRLVL